LIFIQRSLVLRPPINSVAVKINVSFLNSKFRVQVLSLKIILLTEAIAE